MSKPRVVLDVRGKRTELDPEDAYEMYLLLKQVYEPRVVPWITPTIPTGPTIPTLPPWLNPPWTITTWCKVPKDTPISLGHIGFQGTVTASDGVTTSVS